MGDVVWAEPCSPRPQAVDVNGRALCAYLAAASATPPRCPHILIAAGGENFGPLDPASVIAYGGAYRGCTTWKQDAADLERLLGSPMTLGLLYRQTPPIDHPKIHLIPLGPSRGFVQALFSSPPSADAPPHQQVPTAEDPLDRWEHAASSRETSSSSSHLPHAPRVGPPPPDATLGRSRLYYVNHSPTPTRTAIFEQVQRNFGGELRNEYCHRPYERLSECPPSQRSKTCTAACGWPAGVAHGFVPVPDW